MTVDSITYSSLIAACAKGGKIEEALEVFKSMQAAELDPDVIFHSSLITSCAQGGKTEEALEVFKSMQRLG